MSRQKSLELFKILHRTVRKVFHGDPVAIQAAQLKIKEEFNQNRFVDDEKIVKELQIYGHEVKDVLLKRVVQLEQIDEKKYKANIREEMEFGENTIYRDDVTQEEYKEANRSAKKKCKSAKLDESIIIDKK